MLTRGSVAWVLFLVLGLSPAICAAQDGRSFPLQELIGPGPKETSETSTPTSGQVIDSVTGQPIARALVESGDHAMMTDHEGRFSFEHSSPVMAHKPGYLETVTVSEFSGEGTWLLKLTPEAIVYGTVTDANAQPIQRLQVQLRQLQVRGGLSCWQQTSVTTTNAEGEFRFAELQPGKYTLSTGFLVDGMVDAASSLGFVPVVYPQPGADSAYGSLPGETALALHAGEHREANLVAPEERLYTVRGVVRGPIGLGVSFSAETPDHMPVDPAVRFFPDGRFRLRLPVGTYRLRVRSQVNNQQFYGTREITLGPAGLEAVSIDLAALATIPVQFDYEASGNTQSSGPLPFVNLSLIDLDPGDNTYYPAQGDYSGPHQPAPANPMAIHNVPPGRYQVQTNLQPPWYVASASCGNIDLTRDPLVIGEGTGSCALRMELRDNSATIRFSMTYQGGTVQVTAFPMSNSIVPEGSAIVISGSETRQTGTISGLAPGRYLVIAAANVLDIPYRDPGAFEKYVSWGKEVTLGAGDSVEIELKPAHED